MMWPLFICAVVSVAVIIERSVVLKRASSGGMALASQVCAKLEDGRDQSALEVAAHSEGTVGALLAAAIRNSQLPHERLERKLVELAMLETPKLTARLNILDTIITISPLLGLLGTVTGMIASFHVVGDPNTTNAPAAITGGVAEALIATATGLTVAIVTLIGYNVLGEKVKETISSMELASTQVLNVLDSRPAALPSSYENSPARA